MWNYRIQYTGKLSREKTLANFAVLWLFAKVFSAEIVFLTNRESFLPQKFPAIILCFFLSIMYRYLPTSV